MGWASLALRREKHQLPFTQNLSTLGTLSANSSSPHGMRTYYVPGLTEKSPYVINTYHVLGPVLRAL